MVTMNEAPVRRTWVVCKEAAFGFKTAAAPPFTDTVLSVFCAQVGTRKLNAKGRVAVIVYVKVDPNG